MTVVQSVILGIIQGITEFFPISSSGHLIAARYIFCMADSKMGNMAFDTALHFGTLLAICIFFFKDFLIMIRDGFKFKDKSGKYSFCNLTQKGKMLWYIAVASIPAAIAGVLFDDVIDVYIRESKYTPVIISCTLSIMGILLYLVDKNVKEKYTLDNITLKQAIFIGIGQMFAIIPGFSRSGTTMMVARYEKLDRVSAAKFSFLLGVPVILGATCLKLKDLSFELIDMSFVLGVITSFVVGIICIKALMKIVESVGFEYFAMYRVILAIVLVITYIIR